MPGYVYSPFAEGRIVDVRGIDPNKTAVCPYTKKHFKIPTDIVKTPRPENIPTGKWHQNNIETEDGNIGESNGDRAWNGRWIDPSFKEANDARLQTSTIGDIIYFDNEGWITGEAGIAYFDASTKTIQEYPVSGIGEITGIKKTDSKVFVLGEDGFAIFNKANKAVETHTAIGMIRNPADL